MNNLFSKLGNILDNIDQKATNVIKDKRDPQIVPTYNSQPYRSTITGLDKSSIKDVPDPSLERDRYVQSLENSNESSLLERFKDLEYKLITSEAQLDFAIENNNKSQIKYNKLLDEFEKFKITNRSNEDGYKSQIDLLNKQLHRYKERIEYLQNNDVKHQEHIQTLETQLKDLHQQNVSYVMSINSQQDDKIEYTSSQYMELYREFDKLKSQYELFQNEYDNIKLQLVQRDEVLVNNDNEIDKYINEIKLLNNALDAERTNYNLLNKELNDIKELNSNFINEIKNIKDEFERVKTASINIVDKQIDNRHNELNQINADDHNLSLKLHQDQIRTLNQNLLQKQKLIDQLIEERNILQSRVEYLSSHGNPSTYIAIDNDDHVKPNHQIKNRFKYRYLSEVLPITHNNMKLSNTVNRIDNKLLIVFNIFYKYPILRYFFVLYFIIVNLWFIILFFKYTNNIEIDTIN